MGEKKLLTLKSWIYFYYDCAVHTLNLLAKDMEFFSTDRNVTEIIKFW